jgi:hypothetical protein
MSLKLLQPGTEPLGQFDVRDAELTSFKGGEVCAFASVPTESQPGVTTAGFDEAAYDVFDGYVQVSAGVYVRPAVSKSWNTATAGGVTYPSVTSATVFTRPVFLADDGILGYGTLFGAVVGGTVGQQVNGPNNYTGAILGPNTATGSGKMTLWDKPGLYAVSLDAVDTTASTGLQPTNLTLTVGTQLSFTAGSFAGGGGLLTPAGSAQAIVGPGPVAGPTVATFIEFNTNGSLVTTPNYLVAALNSPSGNVASPSGRNFTFATIAFRPFA